MSFIDGLKVSLVLKADKKEFPVPAGNIKHFNVELLSHGFTATVEWWAVSQAAATEDKLFEPFVKKDPIEAVLKVERAFKINDVETKPLVLPGLVVERRVRERAFRDVKDAPVLQRHYHVKFSDKAAVLWREHFPTGVWVDASLKEVIEANKPDGLTLAFKWEAANTKRPLHTLGLGAPGNLNENVASFFDFIHWVQERENAGLFFDPAKGEYSLQDEKPKEGEAVEMPLEDVAELEVDFPEPRRDHIAVLNSYVEAGTKKKEVENANKAKGVLSEYLLTSTVEDDLTARSTLEEKRQRPPEPELRLRFHRYPSITLTPNGLYSFKGDDWSKGLYMHGKQYRLYRLSMDAQSVAQDAADDVGEETNRYKMEVSAALELDSNPVFVRPAFKRPYWPFHVEGLVQSDVGDEPELTYQAKQDDKTSLESYRVKLPLWDKEVLAPYEPNQQPGHFYFPADKGARVLLAMDYQGARVVRFLAWRPGAKLPKESQGNHLLLGKKKESQTSIQHVYESSKPVLRIQRTADKDTQLIEVSNGRLFMEVKEEK